MPQIARPQTVMVYLTTSFASCLSHLLRSEVNDRAMEGLAFGTRRNGKLGRDVVDVNLVWFAKDRVQINRGLDEGRTACCRRMTSLARMTDGVAQRAPFRMKVLPVVLMF